MASCEKCWRDSAGDPLRYAVLVNERDCSPEDQAGYGAQMCPHCGRRAVHQYCHICMACGYKPRHLTTDIAGH